MEENTEQILNQAEETQWEELPWNKHDRYIPTEYQIIDYQRSWKKCHCGRKTHIGDNWCPACGQKLGMPTIEDE